MRYGVGLVFAGGVFKQGVVFERLNLVEMFERFFGGLEGWGLLCKREDDEFCIVNFLASRNLM